LEEKKISIENIGVRVGEKIHETLLTAEERYATEETENFFQVPMVKNSKIKNTEYGIEFTSHNTKQLNAQELAEILLKIPLITKLIKL
jgi:UDP-glucose 4-epimerase